MKRMDHVKSTGISEHAMEEIIALARKNRLNKVILFGSSARGDFYKTSDIDLAVKGGNTASFSVEVDEETSTLLKYDIVDLDGYVQRELLQVIEREGVLIYEGIIISKRHCIRINRITENDIERGIQCTDDHGPGTVD